MFAKGAMMLAAVAGWATVAQADAGGNSVDVHVSEVREGVCATRANGQSARLDNLGNLVGAVSRDAQVRVHAPLDLSYGCVNGVVTSLQQSGFSRIAFVTESRGQRMAQVN